MLSKTIPLMSQIIGSLILTLTTRIDATFTAEAPYTCPQNWSNESLIVNVTGDAFQAAITMGGSLVHFTNATCGVDNNYMCFDCGELPQITTVMFGLEAQPCVMVTKKSSSQEANGVFVAYSSGKSDGVISMMPGNDETIEGFVCGEDA